MGDKLNAILNARFASTKAIIDAMAKEEARPQGFRFVRFLPISQLYDRDTGDTALIGIVAMWFDDGLPGGGVSCLN